ncbi:MAG: hypothetical protein OQK45_03010 [Sulfurovum sp.]|nr:hypothetical protein [Sulfurovum sp.]
MTKRTTLGILSLAVLVSSSLYADKVTDQIQTAIQSYEDKEYKLAIDDLKFAIVQIEKLDNEENKKLLPNALEGWTATAGDNSAQAAMSMMGGGTSIQGIYTRGNEHIEISIIANSPMLAMVGMMINNPALSAADPSTEPYRYKRVKGMKKKEGTTTEITLILAGQIMIKLMGENLKDDAVLEQYLDAMDMKKLKMSLL